MSKPVFFIVCILLFAVATRAQPADSLHKQADTVINSTSKDSAQAMVVIPVAPFQYKNKLLNSDGIPVSFAIEIRKPNDKDSLFYLVALLLLCLAILKYFNGRYFNNLFRVFFNTSLRQSQLTDQLLQSKLISLLFNTFFVISCGFYLYLLLAYMGFVKENHNWILLLGAIALTGIVYFIKYCTLKFTGWMTGLSSITDTYLFIIFLINKIIGIFLMPVIVVLAFSSREIVHISFIVSGLCIAVLILLRFFRSYGLLQQQLKISRFHFFLYLAGIELLPLLLIYKGVVVYLSKNL